MNLQLLFCIGMGLFTTFIGIVMLTYSLREKPSRAVPPKPNFSAKEATMVDPETGEKTTYREITVTTKFSLGPATPPPEK